MNYKQLRVLKIEGDIVTAKLVDIDTQSYSERIEIAHDYVRFSGNCSLREYNGSTVNIPIYSQVSFNIYDFYKFVLPFLNNHEYLQKEHTEILNDRGKINYAYLPCVIQFFDTETKTHKVAMRAENEAEFTIVSYEFYKQFILKQ